MSSTEKVSPKQSSSKPAGTKRDSKPPEPTGESSDSSRARSLSAGRSSSRRLEGTKKLGEAQSKWTLSQSIETSGSDTDDFIPVKDSKKTRFRRSRELKALASVQNSEALANFPTPKTSGKKFVKNLSFSAKSEASGVVTRSASAMELPIKCDDLVVGNSGKVLGYKVESAGKDSDQSQAQSTSKSAATYAAAVKHFPPDSHF